MWALADDPTKTYNIHDVANMYPNLEVYFVMKCVQTGYLDLFKNVALYDGTFIRVKE